MKRTLTIAWLVLAAAGSALDTGATPVTIATPEIRSLPNGLRVAFVPRRGLPIVQVTLAVQAGATAERPDEVGAAGAVRELLMLGTTSRSGVAYASAVDRLGGSITTSLTREHALVSATFLARDLEAGLDLVSDAVIHPLFDEADLEAYKRRAGATAERRDPAVIADAQSWAGVFADHPYARPATPHARALQRLTLQNVRDFHTRCFDPRRALLTVAGDVPPDRAFAAATEWFGRWEAREESKPIAATPPAEVKGEVRVTDRSDAKRAEVRVAFRAPGRGTEDEAAFAVAASALLTGAHSPLAAIFPAGARRVEAALDDGGILVIGGAVPPDSARRAVERILEAARGLAAVPPTTVERARRAAQFALMTQIEPLSGFAARWSEGALEGQPAGFLNTTLERLGAVGPEDLSRVLQRWLDPARAVVVAVGPVASLGDLSEFGRVNVVDPDAPVSEGAAPARTPATAKQLAQGRELVRKAIAAHGGLAKLRAVTESAVEADATLYMGGNTLNGRTAQFRKDPYRMVYTTSFAGVDTRMVLNGDRGWALDKASGTPQARDLGEVEVAGMRSGFEADPPHVLLGCAADGVEAVPLGNGKIGDRDVESIEIRRPDGSLRILHLETKTHRLAAFDQVSEGSQAVLRRVYGDYRVVGGVLWPYSEQRLLGNEPLMRMAFTRVVLTAGMDDLQFEKPQTSKPAPRR